MKNLYLLLLCANTYIAANAQPALQSHPLSMGQQIPFGIGNITNPGASGANVLWDFSSLPLSNGGVFERVDPATTPYYNTFPSCNYVYKISSSTTFYNYYNLTNATFEWVGVRWGYLNINLTPDPQIFMNFPFHYNDKIIDHVKSTDTIDEMDTIVYDGYGTLKTPYGTYSNAIRVKYTDQAGYSIYEWYIADPAYFTYAIVRIDASSTRIFNYLPTAINAVGTNNTASVYLDRISGNLWVRNAEPGARLIMYDLTGKKISEHLLMQPQTTIPVNEVYPGMYLYTIINKNKSVLQTGKLVITD